MTSGLPKIARLEEKTKILESDYYAFADAAVSVY